MGLKSALTMSCSDLSGAEQENIKLQQSSPKNKLRMDSGFKSQHNL
jgi:hypothetical protein